MRALHEHGWRKLILTAWWLSALLPAGCKGDVHLTGSSGGGNTSNSGNFHASNVGVWPAQIQATTGTGPTLITGSTGVTITP